MNENALAPQGSNEAGGADIAAGEHAWVRAGEVTSLKACGAILALVLTAWSGPAQASGFALREGSADWMANAFAGDAAKAYDAATVWANPAGMVRLNASEIDGSLNGIFPTVGFSGQDNIGRNGTVSGTSGGNLIQAAATGGGYGVWNFAPNLKLGLAIAAPFGQRVANPTDYVGRYQSLVSSVSDVAVLAALSYRVNDKVSVGGGPVIDYFSARLTQAINIGPLAASTGDPVADVRGDDVSGGFNLGVLYQPTPDLRFGLDYRSRIQHGITGSQAVAIPALIQTLSPFTTAILAASDTRVRTKITLPDVATAGVYWQASARLALLASLEWTDWSVLRGLDITPTNIGVPGTVIAENWRDSWFVSIGANYRVADAVLIQGGIAYDESPVTFRTRTTRIPDSDRFQIGTGVQYDVTSRLALQLAYSHMFFTGGPILNSATPGAGLIVGKYSDSADTASIGARLRF